VSGTPSGRLWPAFVPRLTPVEAVSDRPFVDQTGARFHQLAQALDYPMFVVTTAANGQRAGCLVGFTTQASIDPPRYLVCLSHANFTYRVAESARYLAVHLLGAGQADLGRMFGEHSGDHFDKFARCRWHEGPYGLPILDGCRAWMVAEIIGRFDCGDHDGVLLSPTEVAASDGGGLLMLKSLPPFRPGHPA
jgi:flavin reductase (DIM6/NTAB) family NADH-FMN oxidoreductase RutF